MRRIRCVSKVAKYWSPISRVHVSLHEMATRDYETEEIECVLHIASTELGWPSLKSKQKEAILAFVLSKDTFVSLPTGYDKSLIFTMLPLVFDKLLG